MRRRRLFQKTNKYSQDRCDAMNKHKQNGFTLVELLIAMTVFIVVLMISADAFKTIITQAAKLFRSEESNIEGVISLEMMRHDLQQAGYGLFTQTLGTAYTGEASIAPASTYNETSFTAPPRALVFGNSIANGTTDNASESGNNYALMPGSDYLAIKGTSVGRSNASQRWTYLKLNAGAVEPNIWPSGKENFSPSEKVVVLQRKLNASTNDKILVNNPSTGDFYYSYSNVAFNNYSTDYYKYLIYGLDDSASLPRMPFNRTDYFVSRPSATGKMPSVCAPNTGVLYKTVVNNSTVASNGGKLTYFPILDCVGDLQIVLGWDLYSGASAGTDGNLDTYSNADGSSVSGPASVAQVQAALLDPIAIRNSLKMVKIYILAQNGRLDRAYSSPSPIAVGDGLVGANPRGRDVNIAANGWENYRWKVYQVVVRPKNLTGNQ